MWHAQNARRRRPVPPNPVLPRSFFTAVHVGSSGIDHQWRRNEYESGGGHTSGAQHREINGRAPPLFWLYKYTISRVGGRFRDGQYSLVSFLFTVFAHVLLAVGPYSAAH